MYRPAARNTASASGRRPISFASAIDLVVAGALSASNRFVVPLDLRVDRVAQAESLVSKLVDVFGVELIARRVDIADRFEKTERKESVNSGKHVLVVGRKAGRKAKLAVRELRLQGGSV